MTEGPDHFRGQQTGQGSGLLPPKGKKKGQAEPTLLERLTDAKKALRMSDMQVNGLVEYLTGKPYLSNLTQAEVQLVIETMETSIRRIKAEQEVKRADKKMRQGGR